MKTKIFWRATNDLTITCNSLPTMLRGALQIACSLLLNKMIKIPYQLLLRYSNRFI